jgi:predicted ester cyclase
MTRVRRIIPGVLFLSLAVATSCKAPPPDYRETNKQVLRDLYAALDAQDYDRINALVAPGVVVRLVGTEVTVPWSEVASGMIPMYYGAFKGYSHVVDQFVAEGDWVVARVTFHGTHTGEFQGAPATGNTFTYGGVHMAQVVDGTVRDFWLLEDDLGLMRQLGMDLVPKAPTP